MNNEQPHINPWAEKLQLAPLPDADTSWKGMERLLDQHLPVEKKEKKRSFFFILFPVILLGLGLMLLGRYLYTASKQPINQQQQAHRNSDGSSTGIDTLHSGNTRSFQPPSHPKAVISAEERRPDGSPVDSIIGNSVGNVIAAKPQGADAIKQTQLAGSKATSLKEQASVSNNYTTKRGSTTLEEKAPTVKKGSASHSRTTKMGTPSQMAEEHNGTVVRKAKGQTDARKKTYRNRREVNESLLANRRKDGDTNGMAVDRNKAVPDLSAIVTGSHSMRTYLLPALRQPVDPLQQLILKENIDQLRSSALSDSVLQAMKKKEPEVIKKGWTFSVGINHFVRINSQQPAPYKGDATTPNSEGLTGKITDYLPVPQAQYHFNNKLFMQGELQFNAPQFTQPVQLEHKSYSDGIFNVTDTAYLKKLTYFNLPLSVHYSPLKRFYIGAGVQYSRLNNAIVLHEETKVRGGLPFPDSSIISSKQERIKGDTLFQKLHTTELRLLADVSYQVGALGIGVRYNYALQNLVKVPVAGGTITQARNSSLQLYIRYRFLDKRKRIQRASK